MLRLVRRMVAQTKSAWRRSRQAEKPRRRVGRYALGRSRTFNLQIKSLLLCQLSYECETKTNDEGEPVQPRNFEPSPSERQSQLIILDLDLPTRQPLKVARQEGLEPPTHSLEGCRSIQLSYWRNGLTGALPSERR